MSRGLGRVERDVLAELIRSAVGPGADPDREQKLNVVVYVTKHHPESVRRAFKSLERKGLVVLGWDNGWLWELGHKFPAGPTARLSAAYYSTLTDEQRARRPVDPVAAGALVADLLRACGHDQEAAS